VDLARGQMVLLSFSEALLAILLKYSMAASLQMLINSTSALFFVTLTLPSNDSFKDASALDLIRRDQTAECQDISSPNVKRIASCKI
jgi:hypothetical protein